MANQWFRLYSEFANDPKVQSMSEAMQRRLVMLFCLRSCDVLVTLREREIAFALRITEQELAETKELFLDKGFITENWTVKNWDKRQYISDSSTDRTRKWRAKQNAKKETSPKRHRNVTVTGPDTDSDTDSDTEQIQNRKEDKSVSTRFRKPDLDEVRSYCNIRKNHVDPQRFLDFYESKGWKVGKTPMKDWKAAVRTWETNGHANGAPILKVHERSTFLDMEEG